ncbi:hypothetical protein C1645_816858 [Glomus cerebriforme]|uniref:Uncharacterized protein n=1 Tax=Glomus cerebriforme TaxID=658196 RepID=A0A397TAQ6_9GLOM|nr:hypothetical protein C1645_816858 [Glomus cerebriforme]
MMKVFLFVIKGIIIKYQGLLSINKAKKTDELLVKKLITSWITTFVKLFKNYSPLELCLPKFHNWCYHVIVIIKEYGVINDYIIETYKFLHKDTIKKPYRTSNKYKATDQMIKMEFNEFFNNYRSKNILAYKVLTVLKHFLPMLTEFFDLCEDLIDMKNSKISWYNYTNTALNRNYIRAKSMYYNEPVFSNMSINMSKKESEDYNIDKSACFGKVLMLINVKVENYMSFDFALIQ